MAATVLKTDFQHPADGWYNIEAKGNHPTSDSTLTQVIDDRAVNSIVNRFNADADDGKLSHGHDMLIDHEHFKHDQSKETIAYGWLQQLQARADGIYGKIRWTSTGLAAVDGGDYRFFSTEYDPADFQILNRDKPLQARPLKLDGLTLTNDPNNKGGKPITNRAAPGAPPIPKVAPHLVAAANQQDKDLEPLTTFLDKVRTIHREGQKALGGSIGAHFNINHAWNHAMLLYPDLHAAAYGLVSATPDDDDASDVQLAGQQLTEVTNRLSRLAGCSLPTAYSIAGQEFPALLHRLVPAASRILNRKKLESSPKSVKEFSAKLLNRFIRAEIASSGHPYSVCLARVMNREPVISQLATNQLAPIEVMVSHPGTWARLQMEME
jgi:hypothetical protein